MYLLQLQCPKIFKPFALFLHRLPACYHKVMKSITTSHSVYMRAFICRISGCLMFMCMCEAVRRETHGECDLLCGGRFCERLTESIVHLTCPFWNVTRFPFTHSHLLIKLFRNKWENIIAILHVNVCIQARIYSWTFKKWLCVFA